MELIIILLLSLVFLLNLIIIYKINSNKSLILLNDVKNAIDNTDKNINKVDTTLREELYRSRDENSKINKDLRDGITNSLKSFEESFNQDIKTLNEHQKLKFDELVEKQEKMIQTLEVKLDTMRDTVEKRLINLQDDNSKKLEKMRETVDEKLQSTLEKRLGESFKIVSDRLEQVHKGLGEMQVLATGVGDLKKVLSNVKAKGILGEYQLSNLLDQILTIEQYGVNVKTKKGSNDNVEFAVKLPGRDVSEGYVWLPIDSKSPTEDFQVLQDAYDRGDIALIESTKKQLVIKFKSFAKDIRDKYLDPPNTTDFGVMFLPYEGLYAEVLRIPGLFEQLQKEYKIIITGPTTLSALLNSLQMGFRTLAIEKRTSEIWSLLGAVKTEFGNFASVLERTKDKLDKATSEIDRAGIRSRSIERKLREVQELPQSETTDLLGESPISNLLDNN